MVPKLGSDLSAGFTWYRSTEVIIMQHIVPKSGGDHTNILNTSASISHHMTVSRVSPGSATTSGVSVIPLAAKKTPEDNEMLHICVSIEDQFRDSVTAP